MQTNSSLDSDWLTIREAFHSLRPFFSSESSLRYHLNNRASNGLAAKDAVRKSPLGVLLVNPPRVKRWALAEPAHKDVA
jgi:hypothetical protein